MSKVEVIEKVFQNSEKPINVLRESANSGAKKTSNTIWKHGFDKFDETSGCSQRNRKNYRCLKAGISQESIYPYQNSDKGLVTRKIIAQEKQKLGVSQDSLNLLQNSAKGIVKDKIDVREKVLKPIAEERQKATQFGSNVASPNLEKPIDVLKESAKVIGTSHGTLAKVKKVYAHREQISREDREFVREELVFIADWIRERYPLTIREANRFIKEMLTVSV